MQDIGSQIKHNFAELQKSKSTCDCFRKRKSDGSIATLHDLSRCTLSAGKISKHNAIKVDHKYIYQESPPYKKRVIGLGFWDSIANSSFNQQGPPFGRGFGWGRHGVSDISTAGDKLADYGKKIKDTIESVIL